MKIALAHLFFAQNETKKNTRYFLHKTFNLTSLLQIRLVKSIETTVWVCVCVWIWFLAFAFLTHSFACVPFIFTLWFARCCCCCCCLLLPFSLLSLHHAIFLSTIPCCFCRLQQALSCPVFSPANQQRALPCCAMQTSSRKERTNGVVCRGTQTIRLENACEGVHQVC